MEKQELIAIRKHLGKTQTETARLLGVSLKGVKSFEQGWRKIPIHVERQVLFLLSLKEPPDKASKACWQVKRCPMELREKCPAWEFHAGHLCWLVNGTMCAGESQDNWHEKMKVCRDCKVFKSRLSVLEELDD